MMQHSFNVKIAEKLGMLEAIIIENIYFWIKKNEANKTNFFNDRYWTYNSTAAFAELFPYATKSQIRRALEHLRNDGILQTGNFSNDAHSRTLWYAFTDAGVLMMQNPDAFFAADHMETETMEQAGGDASTDVSTDSSHEANACVVGECMCHQQQMHVSPAANACVTSDKCMCHQQQMHVSPVTNACVTSDKCIKTYNKLTDINTDNKQQIVNADDKRVGASSPKAHARFAPPTLEEVRDYCNERGNAVDPEAFLSHYESNGWLVGKAKMKDWRAAIRTWERNGYGNARNARKAMTMPDYMRDQGKPNPESRKVDPSKLESYRAMIANGELS